MIIGLHGKARSGKNTVADYLSDTYGYIQESFASPLKEAVVKFTGAVSLSEEDRDDKQSFSVRKDNIHGMARYLGFTKRVGEFYDKFKEEFSPYQTGSTDGTFEYEMSFRKVLQTLGTDVVRGLYEDAWVDMLDSRLNGSFSGVVITDVRFDNEVEYVLEKGGRVLVVSREGASSLAEDTASHSSEAGIHPSLISGIIYNEGTISDLHASVKIELDHIFEEEGFSDIKELE